MIKVQTIKNGSYFFDMVSTLLIGQEAEQNLILGITKQIKETPGYYKDPIMGIVTENEQPALIWVMTPPRPLLLASLTTNPAPVLDKLADYFWQSGIMINEVNAEKDISAAFAHLWGHRGAMKPEVRMRQRIYRLDAVIPQPPVSGKFRKADPTEKPVLTEWGRFFISECWGTPNDERAEKLVETQIQKGTLFVWDDQGPVAMASKSRDMPGGATVSFVFTPKEKRGHGYASNLVAALSQKLLDEGYQFCALYTDLKNPTSNSIYQRIGYRPVMDADLYGFSKDLS